MLLRLATLVVLLLVAASSTSVAQISSAQSLSLQVLRGQPAAAQNSFAYPVDGIVLNAVTGEGIHNALVSIYLGSDLSSLLTGPDGKFHFDHVPPGELGITVQAANRFGHPAHV